MKLERIKIHNFRCIREAELSFNNLTALVGRNGAGKSTFLKAIKAFFEDVTFNPEDFFDLNIEKDIKIEITFCDFRKEELTKFSDYIKNGLLIINKTIYHNDEEINFKYYGSQNQVPQFAEIRNLKGKQPKINAFRQLVNEKCFDDLNVKIRSEADVFREMTEYEKNHSDLLEVIQREIPFLRFKDKNLEPLSEYTKFVLIPAVHDIESEISGSGGAISKLMDLIIFREIEKRDDVKQFKRNMEKQLAKIFTSQNFQGLHELSRNITKNLQRIAPGAGIKISWDKVTGPRINYPSPLVSVTEDQFEGDITNKGHGLQRAIILTLLQQLSEMDHLNTRKEEETNIMEIKDEAFDLIVAIEEPELYQHPSRSRHLSEQLIKMINTDDNNANQIIYSTHSPYFIGLDRFENIRIIRKHNNFGSSIPESIVSSYTLQSLSQDSARVDDEDPSNYTAAGFKARALPIIDSIVSEGFFANVTVVVEGLSEYGVLWKLQSILNQDWSKYGIVIVPANGKSNIDRPVLIFRGLSIPNYFVFDADNKYRGKREEQHTIQLNHKLLRLSDSDIEDFPNSQVNDNWAVFEADLEGIIQSDLGEKLFNEIRQEVSDEFGYDKPSRVMKNIEGASSFVSKVYNKGYTLEFLEKLVRQITLLKNI